MADRSAQRDGCFAVGTDSQDERVVGTRRFGRAIRAIVHHPHGTIQVGPGISIFGTLTACSPRSLDAAGRAASFTCVRAYIFGRSASSEETRAVRPAVMGRRRLGLGER